ncbi:Hypothetical protein NTJ_07073 [Nesidiocoris tenuis]|uniref:Uncharacterized protein n=1 Tax=Nesidiocoris tenuis TaxID=355587 RepID=A0ABN7AS24_9HEMI|nr:Hypothetical protein NTJ_07073 [Nesidiocoris tenuis]
MRRLKFPRNVEPGGVSELRLFTLSTEPAKNLNSDRTMRKKCSSSAIGEWKMIKNSTNNYRGKQQIVKRDTEKLTELGARRSSTHFRKGTGGRAVPTWSLGPPPPLVVPHPPGSLPHLQGETPPPPATTGLSSLSV